MSKIRNFSHGYYAVDGAETVSWPREYVTIPHDLDVQFRRYVDEPVLKLGNGHYAPAPEYGVPADTVAVPADSNFTHDDEVLLAKRTTARELMMQG